MRLNTSKLTFLILAVIASLMLAACSPEVAAESTTVIVPSPIKVPVTVVVTATPAPTIDADPTPTPAPTVEPTPLPPATVAPATPPPVPTATPWVVQQTVEVPVTVVVTATPTTVPTSTPTVTPTPTQTPIPTATVVPPFIQHSEGRGSWLSGKYNFWSERPIVIDIDVQGTGAFSLNAVTPNGCVVQLSNGTAPFTAATLAVPSEPDICDGLNEFGNGTQLTVVAGGNVNWSIDLTQYSQPLPQNSPISVSAFGQGVFGPMRMGQGEMLVIRSEGASRFQVDVYTIYELDPIAARVVDVPADAIGTWLVDVPLGVYMFAITTEPTRPWTVDVRRP